MDPATEITVYELMALVNKTEEDLSNYEQSKITVAYTAAFVCTVLFVAVILRELLKKFFFPFTVLLFVFGSALGILDYNYEPFRDFTTFAKSDIVIQLFLPVIIYELAFGMNPHMFLMAMFQCLILALPGFVLCAALNTVFAKIVLVPYDWDWKVCILYGAILSTTDPSAIIELLKDYGVSSSLTTIIEGESLLNNAIALVISQSALKSIGGIHLQFKDVMLDFAQNLLGAIVFGYIIATGTVALLKWSESDTDMEVTFTFCITYILYFVSEIYLGVSGILAVVVLGVTVSFYKSSINYGNEETTVHQFWQTLSFWANSLIFAIVGLIITSTAWRSFAASDVGFIIAAYFTASVFRCCVIAVMAPFLKSKGYGFTWKYAAVLTWGGLRGAIGLALALLSRYVLRPEVQHKLLIQVSGVIVLTLLFNVPSMRLLLKLLGIGQITEKNMESMSHAVSLLRDVVNTTEKAIRMDNYFAGVDWGWVRQVTQIENPYEGKASTQSTMLKRAFDAFRGRCKSCKAEIRIEPNVDERRRMEAESRLVILRALGVSVANQHSDYGILRRTLGHLNTCIENARDIPEKYLLAEDVIKKFLNISNYVKLCKVYMMRLQERFDIESKHTIMHMRIRSLETETTAFRKWCIAVYLNRRFNMAIYWVLLINVVPIAGEFTALYNFHRNLYDVAHLEEEILVFEILQGVLAMFYVFDAIVRIGAFGCRSYFKSLGNVVDFLVTTIAVIQLIYGIVLLSVHRHTNTKETMYGLVSLGAVRIIRLLRVTLIGIFWHMMNQFCTVFYNAFDLAVGFIVAYGEIETSAHKIVEYDECADIAQFTAENSLYEMLYYLDELEQEHPSVICAWRTHRAVIYILRNMRNLIEEMVDIYMIDEDDAVHLLEEINLKLNDTLRSPRFVSAKGGVRNMLQNIEWVTNEDILDALMENHSLQSFQRGQQIQESGKTHSHMKVIYKGIVKITGNNSGEKSEFLPNVDSLKYFDSDGNFLDQLIAPRSLGLMGYLLQTPSVTSATCSKDCQLINISFERISAIEREFGSLSFYMWRPIALEIAFSVLAEEKAYESWSDERLKIHLEESILPNLENTVEFNVHEVVVDMVIVQGIVKDKETDKIYIGPSYIPKSVRSVVLMGSIDERLRVVMVLLREQKYHARSIMDWIEIDEITYKGLCLVHGVRKASTQLYKTLADSRPSFMHALGKILKTTGGNTLESDAP